MFICFKQEVVGNETVNSSHSQRISAMRPSGQSIFPDVSRGKRYWLDYQVSAPSSLPASMDLHWNANPNFRKVRILLCYFRPKISVQLVPYLVLVHICRK